MHVNTAILVCFSISSGFTLFVGLHYRKGIWALKSTATSINKVLSLETALIWSVWEKWVIK